MNINLPPKATSAIDALDFQVTDFDEARRVLDEVPAGVGALERYKPDYWLKRRRAIRAADKALTGSTIDWIMQLPPGVRPRQLCESFPRLANMLAEAWGDPHTVVAELNNLIVDKRGGRRGLPPAVIEELYSLRSMLCRPQSTL